MTQITQMLQGVKMKYNILFETNINFNTYANIFVQ